MGKPGPVEQDPDPDTVGKKSPDPTPWMILAAVAKALITALLISTKGNFAIILLKSELKRKEKNITSLNNIIHFMELRQFTNK